MKPEEIVLRTEIKFPATMSAALMASVIATLVNLTYGAVYQNIQEVEVPNVFSEASIIGVTFFSMLMAGVIYYLAKTYVPNPGRVYAIFIIAVTLISLAGPLNPQLPDGTPRPEGFTWLTIPMHFVAGGMALWFIPARAKKLSTKRKHKETSAGKA